MDDFTTQSTLQEQDSIFKKIKYWLLFALNPVAVLKEEKIHKWYLYLILPSVGWMIFFLQVGLDKNRNGYFATGRIILLTFMGLIIGYIAVGLIGALLTFILAALGKKSRLDQVISNIALSHTYMTFSVILGLVYSLFGYNSAATFGITGLLCTLLPIYAGIRTLTKGSSFLAPLLATVVGVLLLAAWQLIMYISF